MEIKIDTTNLGIVQDWFKTLDEKTQKNIWMSAFRRASKPLIQTARSFIPYKSKESLFGGSTRQPSYGLHNSMGVVPYPNTPALWVGSKLSTKTTRGDKLWNVWYARLVEWGHKSRLKEGNKGMANVPATHFFENAVRATLPEVIDSIDDEWMKAIDRWGMRLERKLKKY